MERLVISAILSVSIALGTYGTQESWARTGASKHYVPNNKLFKGKVSFAIEQGENLLQQRKYAQAEELFRREVKRNSHNVDAMSGLGLALAMQFKLDGADEEFDKALTKDPTNPLAHLGKALTAINRLQSSSKSITDRRDTLLSQAQGEAQQALNADPTLPQAHYALGMVEKERGQFAEATNEFKQAIESDPSYSDAYAGLSQVDLLENRVPDAVADSRQAIVLNTANSTAHWALGEALIRQGSYDEAIKELNISLYQFRNSAPVHLALGKAYEGQGNVDAALKSYEKAALIKPELKEAYSHMAALHIALGKQWEAQHNTVSALKEYRQATLIDAQNPDPYLHMADLRESRGDLEMAVAELRSGAELNPTATVLQQRIAETLLKLDKANDAVKAFETALTLNPNDPNLLDGLTRALYLKAQKDSAGSFLVSNDYATANQALERAIKVNPNDLRLRLAMAKIRSLAGEPVDLTRVGTPTNDAERISYAEALLAQNKFDEEREQMKTVIDHTTAPEQVAALGDLALMIKDLDSARLAYKKAGDLGQVDRSRRGLAAVETTQAQSQRNLNLGQDLARRRQLNSAVDEYRLSIAENPRMPMARLGLADAEQRLSPNLPPALRDAATQYRAYVALEPNMPPKERQRYDKRIQRLEAKALKIEQKNAARPAH